MDRPTSPVCWSGSRRNLFRAPEAFWAEYPSLATLLNNAAGDARAAPAQRCRLVGVIIAACVDHNRAALNICHGEVRHRHSLRSLAAGIGGQHWHVALVALAVWSKMFAGVGRIVMATRCDAGCWLAVRSIAGTTIRIHVDMESVVARRQVGKSWRDLQAGFSVGQAKRADFLANTVGIDRVHGNRLASGGGRACTNYYDRGSQRHNVGLHQILPKFWGPVPPRPGSGIVTRQTGKLEVVNSVLGNVRFGSRVDGAALARTF